MQSGAAARLAKEIKMLAEDPPPGVTAWPVSDSIDKLEARESMTCFRSNSQGSVTHIDRSIALNSTEIQGPPGSPYEEGTFTLGIAVPSR